MPANQVRRAIYFLRGRLLEIVTSWLFEGYIPRGAIVILRQRRHDFRQTQDTQMQFLLEDGDWDKVDRTVQYRPGDLRMFVSPEGEILHDPGQSHRDEFQTHQWTHLEIYNADPAIDYILVIGRPRETLYRLSLPIDLSEAATLLAPILQLCLQSESGQTMQKADTPLKAVANLIPDLSPQWQYAAILTSDHQGKASFTIRSRFFPQELNAVTSTLSQGQLLSGWTLHTGQVCVVQKTIGDQDPRIAYQQDERAVAAVAVPTVANGQVNGVIYVGVRENSAMLQDNSDNADGNLLFSESQTRILRLLGSLVGEFIARQDLIRQTQQKGLQILAEMPLICQDWGQLEPHFHYVLSQLLDKPTGYDNLDNLHIMAVRLENYNSIAVQSVEVARWVFDVMANAAGGFYRDIERLTPYLFQYSETEFIVVVDHIRLHDKKEQRLRQQLLDHLHTLALPFQQGVETIKVACSVWSLSFRYLTLQQHIENTSLPKKVSQLHKKVEEALQLLTWIYEAHGDEATGSYTLALDKYQTAHRLAPQNTYIMRHIAKAYTRLREYKQAVEWWELVLSREEHAR
ncbi:MAG: GAF domain-containing protein, partial [Chloroflexota bacterium]